MEHWIGTDMGEGSGTATLVGPEGEALDKWTFENHRASRQGWLEEVSKLEGGVKLVLESTESFSERLANEARAAGLEVFTVATDSLKHFRRSEGYEDKRDSLDAYLLGLMGYRGVRAVRPAIMRTPFQHRIRGLGRLRRRLVEQHVQVGQRLRSALLGISPQLASRDWAGPKPTSATFLAVLARWPELTPLHRAHMKTVVREVKQAGRYPREKAEEIARALKQWAADLEEVETARVEAVALELRLLRENLELLGQQIRLLDKEIQEAVESHERGAALLEMPGVGPQLVAEVLAESLPRALHFDEGQLATYSGLTPASRQSGKSSRSRLRRFVNKALSTLHYMSAVASLGVSAIDREYYDKKRRDFQGHEAAHTKAIIALARQRHRVIYRILHGESYNPLRLAHSTLARARRRQKAA